MTNQTALYVAAIALGLIVLGLAGILFNPKSPKAATVGVTMETSAAASKAGAVASPTPETR